MNHMSMEESAGEMLGDSGGQTSVEGTGETSVLGPSFAAKSSHFLPSL